MAVVQDVLYGIIELPAWVLLLLRTTVLRRLRYISHCALPSSWIGTSECANKYDHTVGVAYLLLEVAKHLQLSEAETQRLVVAGLLHDVGTPPFSHTSEHALEWMTGHQHDDDYTIQETVLHTDLADALHQLDIPLTDVLRIFNDTTDPLRPLLVGPYDIDSMEGTIRFCLTMGLVADLDYQELKQAPLLWTQAFKRRCQQLVVHKKGYPVAQVGLLCRERMYTQFLYTARTRAPAAMLLRALDFADRSHQLPPQYFQFTDREAIDFLSHECNTKTSELMERLTSENDEKYYQVVYGHTQLPLETRAQRSLICGARGLRQLADHIAHRLRVPPHHVAVYTQKNKAHKSLNGWHWIDEQGNAWQPSSQVEPPGGALRSEYGVLYVFVAPEVKPARVTATVTEFMQQYWLQPTAVV